MVEGSGLVPGGGTKPTTQQSAGSVNHLTILPFVDLAGRVSDPFVITSGVYSDEACDVIRPEAAIHLTKKRSQC